MVPDDATEPATIANMGADVTLVDDLLSRVHHLKQSKLPIVCAAMIRIHPILQSLRDELDLGEPA